MNSGGARALWSSQCEAALSIRARFGVRAALDYLVAEKLVNFAEAAAIRPDLAGELTNFVAHVRRLFTPEEIRAYVSVLVPRLESEARFACEASEDEFDRLSLEGLAARLERLHLMQQLLEAEQLGTA